MNRSLAIVLFTKNENLGLSQIPSVMREAEKNNLRVFALDASTSPESRLKLLMTGVEIIAQTDPGYNNAWIQAAREAKTSHILVFHPKNTIEPKVVAELINDFNNGFDFVIASRIGKESRNEEDGRIFRLRKWFVIFLGLALWLKSGFCEPRHKDVLHGIRMVPCSVVNAVSSGRCSFDQDLLQVWEVYKGSFRRKDIPVQEFQRLDGATNFPALKTGLGLLKSLFLT